MISSVRLPSVALSSPPTASPVLAATASVAWLSSAASGTMARTESRKSIVWECGATASATSTAGTKIRHPEQRGVSDLLDQGFHGGAVSVLSAMAENPDLVAGPALIWLNEGNARLRQNSPTGKSILIYGNHVKNSRNKKYFCLPECQISAHLSPSRPTQRASAVVTDDGRVAVDAGLRLTTTAWIAYGKTVWSWRPLLASSVGEAQAVRQRRRQQRTRLRGERGISRKAIAQGMSDVLRCPVCSCAAYLVQIAHETAGAARIRSFPAPSDLRGREVSSKPRAQCVARMRMCICMHGSVRALPLSRLWRGWRLT